MSETNQTSRMTDEDLQAIRDRLSDLAPSTASAKVARADISALLDEVAENRRNEESWNKEAERHDRDHRDHYAERELLRAELRSLQNAVRAAFGDLWWCGGMPIEEMLIRARHRLRRDHDEKCSVVVELLRQAQLDLAAAEAKLDEWTKETTEERGR